MTTQTKRKPVIDRIAVYCVVCTDTFYISRKNDKGELVEIQVCPHLIFKDAKIKELRYDSD